jgi:DNA primase
MLTHEPDGEEARAYCRSRDISQASIERFRLGAAPARWDALAAELAREGVAPELAISAGLLKAGQRGPYDFYRNRLMIPTYATTGEVLAFGGRALGNDEPKYLNTATTPVYVKGKHLFALPLARRGLSEGGVLIVVEGYLDCIALHQAGFPNTVAALGTAFTAEQAAELRRYVENVFVCFDGDAAGSAATAKSLDVLTAAGCAARIVLLPEGDDPDSLIRRAGAEGFRALLAEAPLAAAYQIDRELAALSAAFRSPGELASRAEELVRSRPRVEWDRWRVYIAGRLGLSIDDLRRSRFLADITNFAPRGGRSGVPAGARPNVLAPLSFERDVLAIMVDEPSLLDQYRSAIRPERFADERYRELYSSLLEAAHTLGTGADVTALFSAEPERQALVLALERPERSPVLRFPDIAAKRAHLDRIVERIRSDDDHERMRELDRRIDDLLGAGQAVPNDLRDEFSSLVAKLKRSERR